MSYSYGRKSHNCTVYTVHTKIKATVTERIVLPGHCTVQGATVTEKKILTCTVLGATDTEAVFHSDCGTVSINSFIAALTVSIPLG